VEKENSDLAESALTARFANITGLTQTQVDQRRTDGEVPEGLAFQRVRISTILRKYLWTPFNADLLGLTAVLVLIGRPLDAFLSAAAILFAISITVLQELWAQKQLERITVESLPRVNLIRDGIILEAKLSEIVMDDVILVGLGDTIPVGGRLVSDDPIIVDVSARTGLHDRVPKHPGENVLSGSICMAGVGALKVTEDVSQNSGTFFQSSFHPDIRPITSLQKLIQRVLRMLLIFVGSFAVMLLISYATEIREIKLISDFYQNYALIIFGLAPSSLFFIILVYYALGAAEIGRQGGLLREVSMVEKIAHSTTLAVSRTGILTRLAVRIKSIPQPSGEAWFHPVEAKQILGNFAYASTSTNVVIQAIS